LGVLACFFALRRDFDDHYLALQASLARQASQALVRVRLQLELERLALHDQLTGLANRELLQQTVSNAIDLAGAAGTPVSVVFLDLDGFKRINDELGHVVGDAVLKEVGERIRRGVRQFDTVGRYGGDEFVAVCEDADEASAFSIADRIRQQVALPFGEIPQGYSVTASVGVVTWEPTQQSSPSNDQLLSLADSAMYEAKSAGKDLVVQVRR
jgi:diguanylate cyclase (GGDEF)-like protein